MSLEQSATPSFANHQTFHPRFGWLKKGFDAASKDPDVFNRPDAPLILGVGKNMVEAIRFWCTATRVLARRPNPDRPRMSVSVPTGLGVALLSEGGLDPYMEDPTTLWVLHWQAVSPQTNLPVWWSTFNDLTALEFSEPELLRFCVDEIADTTWSQPKESSVQKDVDCLLRMYTARETRNRQSLDDLLDSPFRDLGILIPAPTGRDTYRFVRGAKPTLAPAAVAYACLDFMAMTDPDARTVSLSRLTADSGSPGRLFKLTEEVVLGALEEAASHGIGIRLASPAGTTQLIVDQPAASVALMVLHAHHQPRGRVATEVPGVVAGPDARSPIDEVHATTAGTGARAPRARRGSAA